MTEPRTLAKHARRTGPTLALALLASLSLCTTVLAKPPEGKGGGNGGGGGDDGGTPPRILDAPISYTLTEMRWHEDSDPNFGGLYVETVNSQGLTVGWVRRPNGFVHGVVNVGGSGEATDTMVDLNSVFSASLAATAPGWRIANGRTINAVGLIGCELVQANVPEKDTAPVLLAVASLDDRGSGQALTLVDPDFQDPDLLIMEMNEWGDLLVSEYTIASVTYGNHLYLNTAAPGASPNYVPEPISQITDYRPGFNSSLEVLYEDYEANRGKGEIRTYSVNDVSTQALISGSRKVNYNVGGISESGVAYVWSSDVPAQRITAPGAATPLTEGPSSLRGYRNKVSRAAEDGEEEMVISHAGVIELYKPSYGRFAFPVAPVGSFDNFNISPPHDPDSGQAYVGGHIVYEDVQDVHRAFLLTPEGATPPVPMTTP